MVSFCFSAGFISFNNSCAFEFMKRFIAASIMAIKNVVAESREEKKISIYILKLQY